jgi:adenylate cyclase
MRWFEARIVIYRGAAVTKTCLARGPTLGNDGGDRHRRHLRPMSKTVRSSANIAALLDVDDLVTLVGMSRELASEVHLPRLLHRILAEATRLTDSPDGSVLLLDEERDGLYFADAVGPAAPMLLTEWGRYGQRVVPLVGSKAGQVLTSMTSTTEDAVADDPNHYKGVDRATLKPTESMVCVPLVAIRQPSGDSHAIGVIQILNKRRGNYTTRDRVLLELFAELAAVAIQNAQLIRDLYANKGLYAAEDNVDPRELLAKPAWNETLSVLIADMRGFTQLCQLVDRPERTQAMLNRFLSMLANAVIDRGGVVNKFLGDGLMAFFRGDSHAQRAVDCAFQMLEEFDLIKADWVDSHNVRLAFLDLGIGVSTEDVILGAVGSKRVWDFTAIGTGVNLAAHLMEHARDGRRLLVDKVTFRAARERISRFDGPEEFELRKPGQTVAHPYERYVLYPSGNSPYSRPLEHVQTKPRSIFLSYSHQDENWRRLLRIHLQPYVTSSGVEVWDDTAIEAGEAWKRAIARAIENASLAVFLVSPNLLASTFVMREEFAPVLQRARARHVRLLWLPLSASSYEETEFAGLQAATNPATPLDQLTEPQQHDALVGVCKVIKSAIETPV